MSQEGRPETKNGRFPYTVRSSLDDAQRNRIRDELNSKMKLLLIFTITSSIAVVISLSTLVYSLLMTIKELVALNNGYHFLLSIFLLLLTGIITFVPMVFGISYYFLWMLKPFSELDHDIVTIKVDEDQFIIEKEVPADLLRRVPRNVAYKMDIDRKEIIEHRDIIRITKVTDYQHFSNMFDFLFQSRSERKAREEQRLKELQMMNPILIGKRVYRFDLRKPRQKYVQKKDTRLIQVVQEEDIRSIILDIQDITRLKRTIKAAGGLKGGPSVEDEI